MQRIIVISSFVAHGAVGLQAAVPPLLRPGRDVITLPTVVYSNHLGHPSYAGEAVSAKQLKSMIDALDANGWLGSVTAIMTGFLPSPEHVEFAASVVERVRETAPRAIYLCDPVSGDEPKGLYIREDTAAALRSRLVPLADIITPNAFELGALTDRKIRDVASAADASRATGVPRVAVTSIRETSTVLTNLFVTPTGNWTSAVAAQPRCPHGTGDVFAGLLLAALLDRATGDAALGHAVGGVDAAIKRSTEPLDLNLSGMMWTADAITPADTIALPA